MSTADFLPRRYGARADGVTKDTAAIQAAIDAAGRAAQGGAASGRAIRDARRDAAPPTARVVLDGGTFLTGAIQLRSGVELHIAEGARLLASPDIADFPDWSSPRHVETANLPRGRTTPTSGARRRGSSACSSRTSQWTPCAPTRWRSS